MLTPVLMGLVVSTLTLAALYSSGLVLPLGVTASLSLAAICVHIHRARAVRLPLLSVTNVVLASFVYTYSIVWIRLWRPEVYIALWARAYQTDDIYARVSHISATALLAIIAGWVVGHRSASRPASCPGALPAAAATGRQFAAALLLAIPLFLLARPENTIFSAPYADRGVLGSSVLTKGGEMQLYITKPALYLCLLIAAHCYFAAPTRGRRAALAAAVAAAVMVTGFLAGSRVDELGLLAAILWLYTAARTRFTVQPSMAAAVGAVLLLAVGLGVIRQSITYMTAYNESPTAYVARLFETGEDSGVLRYSQAGGVTVTTCATVGLLESGVFSYDHGRRFLEYLSQTLPRSMAPNRPEGLSVELTGMQLSNGGLFIINEPLLAFGIAGVAATMFLGAFFVGRLERIVRSAPASSLWWLLYAFAMFAANRAVMYGLFTLYKNALAFLGLLALCRLLSATGRSARRTAPGRLEQRWA
ncbi:MAG: hypothetical protein IT429_18735 [Gemmataceae bacterium]|nr:hypothetical protein [Gemmataceae bacterium]